MPRHWDPENLTLPSKCTIRTGFQRHALE
nr:hypothetical protein [Wolbachia endosymbiont (group A) of Anomoia purmunda]